MESKGRCAETQPVSLLHREWLVAHKGKCNTPPGRKGLGEGEGLDVKVRLVVAASCLFFLL